ncbi:MAG: hypothetical protein Q8938_19430 [Bacteroidota bacterium]|nr:hypothetical protein [Bacteroidota bacterium]
MGTLTRSALHINAAPEYLQVLLHNAQTQAGSGNAAGIARPEIPVEQMFLVGERDANAIVGDRKGQTPGFKADMESDDAVLRRIFDRIGKQVDEDIA